MQCKSRGAPTFNQVGGTPKRCTVESWSAADSSKPSDPSKAVCVYIHAQHKMTPMTTDGSGDPTPTTTQPATATRIGPNGTRATSLEDMRQTTMDR